MFSTSPKRMTFRKCGTTLTMLHSRGQEQIARVLGVTQQTVSNWLQDYDVTNICNDLDNEALKVVRKILLQEQIARVLGVDVATVCRWFGDVLRLQNDLDNEALKVVTQMRNIFRAKVSVGWGLLMCGFSVKPHNWCTPSAGVAFSTPILLHLPQQFAQTKEVRQSQGLLAVRKRAAPRAEEEVMQTARPPL